MNSRNCRSSSMNMSLLALVQEASTGNHCRAWWKGCRRACPIWVPEVATVSAVPDDFLMRLSELADPSVAVAAASARTAKIGLLAERLRTATPEEVAIAVHYLSCELPQRQIGVGWAALRELPAPALAAELELAEVDRI